ncbi:MAG: cyclase family protein [Candidatus Hydrogenedentes bacterium]|nr:cyclase family protein [Candidatus Hydrogenedentota bacterium]
MAIRWIDVSIPMKHGMTTWPGDPPFERVPEGQIAQGAGSNTSRLTLTTHTGTHVDAPWHFEEDGRRLDEIDPAVFFGDALLVDLPHVESVSAGDLGGEPLPARILFKTRNSELPVDAPFQTDYVALGRDAAERLADERVRLVGVDYLSVAPWKQDGQATHHVLLRNDVLVVEGLRLAGLTAGIYPFTVLPLPLEGADGAPCRAFVGLNHQST